MLIIIGFCEGNPIFKQSMTNEKDENHEANLAVRKKEIGRSTIDVGIK